MSTLPLIILIVMLIGGSVAAFLQYWESRRYREALEFLREVKSSAPPASVAPLENEVREFLRAPKPKSPGTDFLSFVSARAALSAPEPLWYRRWQPHGSEMVVDHVRRVAAQGGDFDPRLMCDVAMGVESAKFRATFPNLLISSALILGLAGTFLAFRSMLRESDLGNIVYTAPAAQNSAQIMAANDRLLPAFQVIYSRLSQAFYSSLAGIGVTVILITIRSLWVNARRDEFFTELEEFTSAKLLRHYGAQGSSAAKLIQAADKAAQTVQSVTQTAASLEKLSGSLVALTERVEKSLGQNSQLGTVLDSVSKQLASTEGRWKTLLDSLETSRLSMGKVVGHVQEHSDKVIFELKKSGDEATARLDAFARTTGAEMKTLAAARLVHFDQVNTTIVTTSERLLTSWRERSELALNQQGLAAERLLSQSRGTEESLVAAQQAQYGKLAESLTAHATASADSVQKVAGDFLNELRVLLAQREGFEQVTLKATAQMARLLAEHEQRQNEYLKAFGSDTRQVGAEARHVADEARQVTAVWSRGVGEASDKVEAAAGRLVEALERQRPTPAYRVADVTPTANGIRPPPPSKFFDLDRSPVLIFLGRRPKPKPEA